MRFGTISSLACPAKSFVSERASGGEKVYLGSLELARSRLRGNTQLIIGFKRHVIRRERSLRYFPRNAHASGQALRFSVTRTCRRVKSYIYFIDSYAHPLRIVSHRQTNKRTKPRATQTPTLNPSQTRHPRVLRAPEATETTDAPCLPSTLDSPSSSSWRNYENTHVQCVPDAK